MRKLVSLTVCGILFAGCASSSRSTMLTDDTALISVLSQGGSDRAKIVDQALAEAAQATRATAIGILSLSTPPTPAGEA